MKLAIGALLLACSLGAAAQEQNPTVGVWKRNNVESTAPGEPPQTEVREYREGPDGYLTGLAVWVDAGGRPGFLQFAAKSDGNFYPEYDSETLSELQAGGQQTQMAYSEKIVDAQTIEWVDHFNGTVTYSGTKTFSDDGRKMTILVNNPRSGSSYTLVYDKQ